MFDIVVILCPTLFHEICDSCRRSPDTNLFVLANLSLERTPYDVNTSIVEKWVSHDRNT